MEEEDADDDNITPRLHMVISQAVPSRPDSVLMNIDGSLPVFDSWQGEKARGDGEDSLPPSPPSPPASENSDWEDDAPMVPTTAPPPIPVDSTHPLVGELPPIPADSASPSATEEEDRVHSEQLIPSSSGPLPLPDRDVPADLSEVPPPALPTSMPPLISDYSNFDADTSPPSLLHDKPPPLLLLSKDASKNVNGVPSTGSDERFSPLDEISPPLDETSSPLVKGSLPPGFIHLEIDLKKRAMSGLGVTVESSGAPTSDLFMIRRIMAVGAAAKDGRMKPGDRLVAVNGKSLAGLNHAAVLQELNSAPKDCHLTVWRDPSFETAAITPTFTGSRTSLGTISDDEEEGVRKFRSLSTNSLDKSPLAKKLSTGRGISPRGSPLAHSRLQSLTSAHSNGSPLSKRWSAESFPIRGPAGELLDLPPLSHTSPPTASPDRGHGALKETEEYPKDNDNLPPMDTPPLPPGTPPTDTPPQLPGTSPTDTPPQLPGTPPTDTPPQLPGTPPTDTPPQLPGTPPIDTPPLSPRILTPPIPSAPPSTMVRGLNLDLTKVANALGVASESDEEGVEEDEAPPPVPQTTPPPTKKHYTEEREADDEAPPSLPQTTPPLTAADEAESEVERPKSLGPVPKGTRLDDAPFEIEVSRGLIGGLGMSVCENELGMIAVKALTNRSPITKDGNIRYVRKL